MAELMDVSANRSIAVRRLADNITKIADAPWSAWRMSLYGRESSFW